MPRTSSSTPKSRSVSKRSTSKASTKKAPAKKPASKAPSKSRTPRATPKRSSSPKDAAAKKTERYFKVMCPGHHGDAHFGRFTGRTPKQAGAKAFTSIIKERKASKMPTNKPVHFVLTETTRGSKGKAHYYVGQKVELKTPNMVEIKVKDKATGRVIGTKTIPYHYDNRVVVDKEAAKRAAAAEKEAAKAAKAAKAAAKKKPAKKAAKKPAKKASAKRSSSKAPKKASAKRSSSKASRSSPKRSASAKRTSSKK